MARRLPLLLHNGRAPQAMTRWEGPLLLLDGDQLSLGVGLAAQWGRMLLLDATFDRDAPVVARMVAVAPAHPRGT